MASSKTHPLPHKYERRRSGKKKSWVTYNCVLEGCTHFLPTIELLIGRESICWKCGNKVVLTRKNLGQKHPTCPDGCEITIETVMRESKDLEPTEREDAGLPSNLTDILKRIAK